MTTTIGWISAAVRARMSSHPRSGVERRRGAATSGRA